MGKALALGILFVFVCSAYSAMCRGLLHPQGLTPQLPSDSHGLSFIPVSHLSLKSRNIFHGAIQAPPQYPQGSKPHLGCEREDSKEGCWDGFIRSTLDPTCAVRAEHHCFEHSRETEFLQGVTPHSLHLGCANLHSRLKPELGLSFFGKSCFYWHWGFVVSGGDVRVFSKQDFAL